MVLNTYSVFVIGRVRISWKLLINRLGVLDVSMVASSSDSVTVSIVVMVRLLGMVIRLVVVNRILWGLMHVLRLLMMYVSMVHRSMMNRVMEILMRMVLWSLVVIILRLLIIILSLMNMMRLLMAIVYRLLMIKIALALTWVVLIDRMRFRLDKFISLLDSLKSILEHLLILNPSIGTCDITLEAGSILDDDLVSSLLIIFLGDLSKVFVLLTIELDGLCVLFSEESS